MKPIISKAEQHSIELTACPVSVSGITEERLRQFCNSLLDYLTASPEEFRFSKIRFAVASELVNSRTADLTIRMNGSINGTLVEKTIQKRGTKFGTATGVGAAAGGAIGAAIGYAVDSVLTKKSGAHDGLQRELSKSHVEIVEAFDSAIERRPTDLTMRWKKIQFASVVVPIFVYFTLVGLLILNGMPAPMAGFISAWLIAPVVFAVLAIGMSMMPNDFFYRESTGQRVLRFSGVKTPFAARIVVVSLAVLLLVLSVGFLFIVRASD